MKKILFDSDVLIEYLRGNPNVLNALDELAQSSAILAVTPVTIAEIHGGLRSNEKNKTEKLLDILECLPLTAVVGKWAGYYIKTYGKSHGVELADALIAGCAVTHHFHLCTFNWKHYPMQQVDRYVLARD